MWSFFSIFAYFFANGINLEILKMTSKVDCFQQLPNELTLYILSYLEVRTLGRCCRLNSHWNDLTSDNSLWREVAKKHLGGIPKGKLIKKVLDIKFKKTDSYLLASIAMKALDLVSETVNPMYKNSKAIA